MGVPGIRAVRAQRDVLIHIEGRWQAGCLTEWRLLPAGYWVGNVRWRADPDPTRGWAWVRYSPAVLKPLPEPPAPAPARTPGGGTRH